MKCDGYRPLLSKYADGETTPGERAMLESHLGACPQCTALLAQFRIIRVQMAGLTRHQPDPRLRSRLFAAMDSWDAARAEEVPITRRIMPTRVRPVPAPRALRLFGNLASAAALLVVMAAGMLVWQMTVNVPSTALASPTTTRAVSVIQVPTVLATIGRSGAGPQPTGVAGLPVISAGRQAASPTVAFNGLDDAANTMHSATDEHYGYTVQYPGGWWTASALPAAGVLAHRLLRPVTRAGETVSGEITIDVRARDTSLSERDMVMHWKEPNATIATQAAAAAGLTGFTTVSTANGIRRRVTYLFDKAVVYALALQSPVAATPPGSKPAGVPAAATAAMDAVLAGFHPVADATAHPEGYTPALFVHNNDLWVAGTAGAPPRQLTHEGRVRSFALAPDLTHVALLLARDAAAVWPDSLLVRTLDNPTATHTWQMAEVHSVAWYADQDLLVIARPAATSPLGLQRVPLGGQPRLLLDLHTLPDGANLRVSPDRRWITFMAGGPQGPDLYGMQVGGPGLRSLLPSSGKHPAITGYAWFAPADQALPHLIVLGDGQLQALIPPAGNGDTALSSLLTVKGDLTDLAVGVDGRVAVLSRSAGGPVQAFLPDTWDPSGPYRAEVLPGSGPLAGTLDWCTAAHTLCYRRAGDHLVMVDVSGPAATVLRDVSLAPAP